MRFKRTERYERIILTARQLANASRRIERQAQKLAADYPLFSDQLEKPMPLDEAYELERRERMANASEQRMRALHARVWREARRDYAAASPEQRAAIREAWNAWRGPLTCLYFRYVVDEHTGVNAARTKAFRQEQLARRQQLASIPRTASIFS